VLRIPFQTFRGFIPLEGETIKQTTSGTIGPAPTVTQQSLAAIVNVII
jgi:hypothetical protein